MLCSGGNFGLNVDAADSLHAFATGFNGNIIAGTGHAPVISSISPDTGLSGTAVTVKGANFGSSEGTSSVAFNGVPAGVTSWSEAEIVCNAPGEVTTGPVVVTTPFGSSDGAKFTVPQPTWYLAEGTSAWGFTTYLSIENPNQSPVHAVVTYMTSSGPVPGGTLTLPARSQTTVNPAGVLGEADFSTKVSCKEGKTIAVDRTMTWTGPGAAAGEAHNSIGVTSPAKTWYLPEGSSAWGFECWLLIQNPNGASAQCTVTYMIEGAGPQVVKKSVPANSRASFDISEDIGARDASIKVESKSPVIPERAMYRNARREGHCSIGTTSTAHDYYLAEGTTAWGFTTYVLVQNPNPTANQITITFMTPEGPKAQAPFEMPAGSRKTVRVNDVLPGRDLSTQVHGVLPVIAERAMYWGEGTALGEACHDSIGMPAPHDAFYLPDGQTSDGWETWTLVQNPGAADVTVRVIYLTGDGKGNVTFDARLGPRSRRTFSMADSGFSGRGSVMVTSRTARRKIMVERAMYWNSRSAGTDTIGGFSD